MQARHTRAALTAFGLSQANLRSGKVSARSEVLRVYVQGSPKLAPNGRMFAALVAEDLDPAQNCPYNHELKLTVFYEGAPAELVQS